MSLRVDMTGNQTGFTRMLETARVQVKAFAASVSEEVNSSFTGAFKGAFAGSLTFQGLSRAIGDVIGQINDLRNLTDQLGSGDIEGIQKWAKAFERAGGSVETMTRIVGEFQDKRQAAMGHDLGAIKAREELERMGFTAGEINPTTGMDPLAFMGKAFKFANSGTGNSAFFESIFGPRTTRFAGAAKYLPEMSAPINQETFETMKETEQALDNFKQAIQAVTGKILALLTVSTGHDTVASSLAGAESASNTVQANINRIRAKGKAATPFEQQWMRMAIRSQQPQTFETHTVADWMRAILTGEPLQGGELHQIRHHARAAGGLTGGGHAAAAAAGGATTSAGPGVDLDAQNQMEAWKQEEDAALESLHSIQEAHMTIGDRLKLIGQDIEQAHKNTLNIQGKLNSPTLGVSGTAWAQMTDIEKAQLRHQLTMDLRGAQSKEASLRNAMFQSPLTFQADNLAKVGLYSASALRFNPVLGLQQRANQLLERIATNTSKPTVQPPHDPHRP